LRFTVRRPADAEVCSCCHRPSGGDVACCVDVGVAASCSAGVALEHRLALAVSGSDVPAHRAALPRVGGRDLLDPTVSFVLQPCGEQTPTAAAEIDTDHRAITVAGYRRGRVSERDMPAPGPVTGNPVGLHAVRHRGRAAKADPADLGHPHPPEASVELLDVMRLDRDLPKPLVHTGFAPRRAPVRATEEVPHRLREIPQRLLLHRLRARRQPIVFCAGRGQLRALLVVDTRAVARLPMRLLLDRQIPHVPGMAAMLGQPRHLSSRPKQPVSRHTHNVTTYTDTTPKGEVAFPPPAKAKGFHAATPR
jgi:hypothetical protein